MMTKSSEESDESKTITKIVDAAELARDLFQNQERIKALELTEKTISDHGNHESCFFHHELQGDIFFELATETNNTDVKCVYLFASVDAYSMATLLCPDALRSFRGYARSMIQLGNQLRINQFYKKAVTKAKRGLLVTQPQGPYMSLDGYIVTLNTQLQNLIDLATKKMHAAVTVSDTGTMANQIVTIEKDPSFDRLKNFWVNLDDKTKREFLLVDSRKLIDYVENKYGNKVKEDFGKCVSVANNLPWRGWKCHICSQVNYSFTDCERHILDNHVQNFVPDPSGRPKCVDKVLADMICCGKWEPVDTVAAANLINDRAKCGEEFVYVNGWCSDWPEVKDEERRKILKQFAQVLKSSFCNDNDTLSRTLWDWLIDYTERNLQLLEVPGNYLDKCGFFKNPQCICFLDLKHLEHILKYFIQLTTDVCAGLVSKVVNQFWENSQVKERIDLEGVTTYNLLLDKRLLYEEELESDKIGTVEHYKSTAIYEDVMPKGDKIVSWILDCPEIDREFVSQMANGLHNREIWLAALNIVRGMVRKKESYYDKRHKMLTYEKMLCEAETICDREDTRKNVNQRSTYEFALRMKCEELVGKQDDDTKCFLSVVRDVFQRKSSPRFEVLEDKEDCISKLSTTIPNDDVKKSLWTLRKSLKEKFPMIDSKILRNKSTYKKLIDVFPKLSAVEYRLVVLPFVKNLLQDKLKKMMKTNSSSVAAGDSAERKPKKRHLSNEVKDLINPVSTYCFAVVCFELK
ncbi:unnamed protein product [Arabidopsis halleri]